MQVQEGSVVQEASGSLLTARPGLQAAARPTGQDTEQEPQLPTARASQREPLFCWMSTEFDGVVRFWLLLP